MYIDVQGRSLYSPNLNKSTLVAVDGVAIFPHAKAAHLAPLNSSFENISLTAFLNKCRLRSRGIGLVIDPHMPSL